MPNDFFNMRTIRWIFTSHFVHQFLHKLEAVVFLDEHGSNAGSSDLITYLYELIAH
jgi:hypothetical protein